MISRRSLIAGAAAAIAIPRISFAQAPAERWSSHWEARQAIIKARAIGEGTGGIALIGDSITETMWWPEVGGKKAVNLGFGAARTRNLLQYVPSAIEVAKPDAAIIMASINNSIGGLAADEHEAYPNELRDLVRSVKASVRSVSLVTITPVEDGRPLAGMYENGRVLQMNEVIRSLGAAEGVKVYDAYGPIAVMKDITFDGVHLTAEPYKVIKGIYDKAASEF